MDEFVSMIRSVMTGQATGSPGFSVGIILGITVGISVAKTCVTAEGSGTSEIAVAGVPIKVTQANDDMRITKTAKSSFMRGMIHLCKGLARIP
jgi:hypothetical protein